MGTERQATALMALMVKAGQPIKNPEETRQKILAADQQQIQAAFDDMNEKIGWNKKTSPATSAQLLFLSGLEKQLFGTALDFSTRGRLTYEEADQTIRTYKQELAEREALRTAKDSSSAVDAFL